MSRGEQRMVPEARPTSYYGQPILKKPVWKPEVGVYLWTGGMAGGSAMLATSARALGNPVLARRALYAGVAAAAVSPALLIEDLGVPHRFYNMLRVFKVTSPMNMGTWILSGAGTGLGLATACEMFGVLPRFKAVAEAGAALLGPPLATYTAALLADTAVPVWHNAQAELPFLFAGSAAATAGAAATVLTPSAHAGLARTLAVGGTAVELVATEVMERRLGELGEPYHQGRSHHYGRAAKLLGLGGAAALAVGGRRRGVAVLGGLAVMAASFCERMSIFHAGTLSAEDPRYVVGPQRRRLEQRVSPGYERPPDLPAPAPAPAASRAPAASPAHIPPG